jgi:diguanylate cyclase (GGDEF)-like protein
MPLARYPGTEADRLAALRSYDVLDTAFEKSFDNIAHLAAKLTGSPMSLVSFVDADRQWFKARHGLEVSEVPREFAFCAHAILQPHEALVVPDTLLDPRFADNPMVLGEPEIRFYAGQPLVNSEGFALGTLCIIDREPREFSDADRETLMTLAETVMTTLELRRTMIELRNLALVDVLTGLPNRAALLHAIERAIGHQRRRNQPFALLYLDLDGFKTVNDRYGHSVGDLVLRRVARTLLGSLRQDDLAVRLGGDEFAVLLTGAQMDVAAAAARICSDLERDMAAEGWKVTASVGAITFSVPPIDVDAAVTAADALMYGAKTAGKNRVIYADR